MDHNVGPICLDELAVYDQTGGRADAAIVFLHGSGDDGPKVRDHFEQMLEEMQDEISAYTHVKIYFPTAPKNHLTLRDQVTTSWFDGIRNGRKLEDVKVNYEEANAAAAYVVSIIDEIEASGIPRNRIFIGGISQGGMLAQYVAYVKTRGLAGVCAMASIYPFTQAVILPPPHPKCLILYGAKDPIIPLQGVRLSQLFLKMGKVRFVLKVLPDSSHDLDEHFVKHMLEHVDKELRR
ncbi:Hypothetical protein NTJ_09379 [Nesidiocoris tenuis]|uniref:palmitoyl-protein hydrolase n=1 Tax=Nesidiocoris tenuis TaxID=355587 RepID=A0ABN7AWK6_9HEMI|nr:Hypothetical protein NTJ_09379 [Nesidiocoris tenuis]